MLLFVVGLLVVLWLVGFVVHIGGALIHLLLLVALIVLIYDLITRNRSTN